MLLVLTRGTPFAPTFTRLYPLFAPSTLYMTME